MGNKPKSKNNTQNIELFLRHRAELYLQHSDYETALFYAERLLSESDDLSTRLLVAKCYKESKQYNRAYHVLHASLHQNQTNYQRHLEEQRRNNPPNRCNDAEQQNPNDISFGIDPLTP